MALQPPLDGPAAVVGIVYLVYSPTFDAYKIGMTECWARRSKQLKVGTATKFVMIARVHSHRMVERELHLRFSTHRLPQSEWLKLTDEQLEHVTATLKRLEAEAASTPRHLAPKSQSTQSLELAEETYILRLADYFRKRDEDRGTINSLEYYVALARARYQAGRDETNRLLEAKYLHKNTWQQVYGYPLLFLAFFIFAASIGHINSNPAPEAAPTTQNDR